MNDIPTIGGRPSTQSPSVAIVLVNWNGWRDSIACIRSCLALSGTGFRIILCDNDSGDGSVERILAWARSEEEAEPDPASPVAIAAPRLPHGVALLDRAAAERGDDADGAELILVRTGGNLGFAGGNNVGLRWAMAQGCDYAWLLNNDTVVPPDALSTLIATMEADRSIGVAGSLLLEYHSPDLVQACAGALDRTTFRGRHLGPGVPLADRERVEALIGGADLRPSEILYPVGASMLVSRTFLDDVGLMEESYFLYYEESDWVLRAAPRYRVGIVPDSHVYHRHGASAGTTPEGTSARSVGFLYRSRLRIARRFAPARLPQVVLGMLIDAAKGLARGRTAKARAAASALTGRVHVPISANGNKA